MARMDMAQMDLARMMVVYRTPEDVEDFSRHYFETHVPLVKRLPGLRKYEVSHGPIICPADSFDAYMIATLHFDDMAALRNALASEEGQACGADRRKFAPDTSGFQTFLFENKNLAISSSDGTVTPKLSRAEVHQSAEIPASASQVWDLLTDWAGMLRWWLSAEQGGLPGPTLVKCDLVGKHGVVPRTRRMILDNGLVVEEKIFHQDDNSRRIYYSKTEPPGSPVRGYIATAYVDDDDIEADRCTLHISSSFDVEFPATPEAAVTRFESIYQSMFRGFQHYFSGTKV
jgi:uncharacterized protein (TIGR02118 family)